VPVEKYATPQMIYAMHNTLRVVVVVVFTVVVVVVIVYRPEDWTFNYLV